MLSDLPQILKLIMAMLFVLSLMGLLAFALKKLGLSGAMPVNTNKKRLKLIEVLHLDSRHKAALIQRDNTQHLVILGPNGETVIETDIKPEEDNENSKTE